MWGILKDERFLGSEEQQEYMWGILYLMFQQASKAAIINHFINGEREIQRGSVFFPRSHSHSRKNQISNSPLAVSFQDNSTFSDTSLPTVVCLLPPSPSHLVLLSGDASPALDVTCHLVGRNSSWPLQTTAWFPASCPESP